MVELSYLRRLRRSLGHSLILMPAVAAIVRRGDGAILLHRRADTGTWSLPAGAIEPGETPGEAVVREVREETGLAVEPAEVAGIFGGREFRVRYPNGDETEYVVTVFACRLLPGPASAPDGETLELGWFAVDDLPRLEPPYPPETFVERRSPCWN